MREVAVLGGSGFIGSPLVAALAERGCQVRVISRQAAGLAANVVYIKASVGDAGAIRAAISGCDTVFHLATGGGDTWADFERDFVGGARNVAEACLGSGVRRLIYTSSVAALYLGGADTITGATPPDPKPLQRGLYARAKIQSERLLTELHATRGLPLVILRPAVVVGCGGMLNHSGAGFWGSDVACIGWGHGRTPVPFVLVDDVVQALLLAMDAPGIEGRAFNLAGDVRPNAMEYVRIVAERSRRQMRFYPRSLVTLQMIDIAKWLVKIAARKPENPFPSLRDLKSRAFRAHLDCTDAKTQLGWKPNADFTVFVRDAIDCQLRAIPPGDLRLPSFAE